MKLYIQTENGQPVNHPALEENLIAAFGGVPDHWKPFVRVAAPILDRFEVYEGATYEWDGLVFTDVHHVRPMTDEEKATRIAEIKAASPGDNWRWDEPTLRWVPVNG